MLFAFAFNIDENVIKVHYYENVELICWDLVDIALERGRCIGKSKRHDLVLKVTIVGLKGRISFIAFLDPHLIVGMGQIELDKTSSPT